MHHPPASPSSSASLLSFTDWQTRHHKSINFVARKRFQVGKIRFRQEHGHNSPTVKLFTVQFLQGKTDKKDVRSSCSMFGIGQKTGHALAQADAASLVVKRTNT